MPSKPWFKSSSSQSLDTDPGPDYSRSQSRQASYPNPTASEGAYNPYIQQQSFSPVPLQSPHSLHLPAAPQQPASTYPPPTLIAQPYEHPSPTLDQQGSGRLTSGRKSVKSRLLSAAADVRGDAPDKPLQQKEAPRGLFGRRKSIRKDAPPIKTEPSAYESNSAQWQPSQSQPSHSQAPSIGLAQRPDRFESPLSDFSAPQHQHQQQQQYHEPPRQAATLPYPDIDPRPDTQQPRIAPPQYHHAPIQYIERAPSSAGSGTSPNRPSFESVPRPPSRPETNSRPNSRASYDRYNSGQQNQPLRPPADQGSYDPRSQTVAQDTNNSLAYRPYQRQQPPRSVPSPEPSKMSTPTSGNREPGGGLQLPGMGDNGRQGSSGLSPNLEMGPPPMGRPRDSDAGPRAPGVARAPSDLEKMDVRQMTDAHRRDADELSELKKKYNNVKRQYFTQKEQVDTLQNTLANQRLSASRTQLDDSEYVRRMQRLDGLVSQLAFSIRKDWARVPEWLEGYVNKEALQAGKQEMTAVGRAFMSRWLADELFDKYFHPDLEPNMSAQFKRVQKNIREVAPPFHTEEEKEDLTAKINVWRLTTVDGLRPILESQQAASNRSTFTEALSQQLIADFGKHMNDPPPADLNGGIPMIVELALGMLANLPQESRDVHIEYFNPGSPIYDEVMKVEAGIPALIGGVVAPEPPETDQSSINDTASASSGQEKVEVKFEEGGRKSFLGGLMGNKKPKGASLTPSQPSSIQATPVQSPVVREEEQQPRVRMCVFLSLQIRGKMVLAKAPVYKI